MSEDLNQHNSERADPSTVDSQLSQELAAEVLHDSLTPIIQDIQNAQYLGQPGAYLMLDQSLSNGLNSFDANLDEADPAQKLRLAVLEAMYQGGTRSPVNQGQLGHQPFSDRLNDSDKTSDDTKKFLNYITDNKAGFLAGLQQEEPNGEQTGELANGMSQHYYHIMDRIQDPETPEADKGALAMGLVYVIAASAEAWNLMNIHDVIERDISPLLADV